MSNSINQSSIVIEVLTKKICTKDHCSELRSFKNQWMTSLYSKVKNCKIPKERHFHQFDIERATDLNYQGHLEQDQ